MVVVQVVVVLNLKVGYQLFLTLLAQLDMVLVGKLLA
jgi:hypothetical protein